MHKHFVWIVADGQHNAFKRQGVSTHYIIPIGMTNGLGDFLPDSNIWLIIRSKHHVIAAYLQPKMIERFLDGINKDDLLLTVDLQSSFKITNQSDATGSYTLDSLRNFSIGMNEISPELNYMLIAQVVSKIQTKLQSPRKHVSGIKLEYNIKSINVLAKKASHAILQTFCLDDVWASQMGIVLTPFANFAHALLSERVDKTVVEKLLPKLKSQDPLLRLVVERDIRPTNKVIAIDKVQVVDDDFIEIDTNTIYAREFVGIKHHPIDIETALAKTEIAEKLHQEMLRDISLFLRTKKIIPYESSSIDLMFETRFKTIVVEIKSTNELNLLAQCSKGAFQLSYYVHALQNDFEDLNAILVIHKTQNPEQEQICLNVLDRLNTKCLIYDPSLEWPNRLRGLLDL